MPSVTIYVTDDTYSHAQAVAEETVNKQLAEWATQVSERKREETS